MWKYVYRLLLCCNFSGPISSGFVNKYGCRAVTIAGTVIAGGKAFICFFFLRKPWNNKFSSRTFCSLSDSQCVRQKRFHVVHNHRTWSRLWLRNDLPAGNCERHHVFWKIEKSCDWHRCLWLRIWHGRFCTADKLFDCELQVARIVASNRWNRLLLCSLRLHVQTAESWRSWTSSSVALG